MTPQHIIAHIGPQPNRRLHYHVVAEVHSHVWNQVDNRVSQQVQEQVQYRVFDQLRPDLWIQDQLRSDWEQL